MTGIIMSWTYHDLINEYNILEYNDIFGGKDRDLEFFADVQPD